MKKQLLLSLSVIVLYSIPAFANPEMAKPAQPETATQPEAAKQPEAKKEPLVGKIVQKIDSSGYTYIYLKQKDGKKIWVAVSETPLKIGSTITLKPGMEMKNFESKSLKRKFDSIIFSDGVIAGAIPENKATKIKEQGKSVGSSGAVIGKIEKVAVGKATGAGATTVADAFKNSAKLKNKQVVVKGKVVKVSSGIMGKNWIHIQDGTGSEANKTHNLVCTSKQLADVGDIITVTGKLRKDKDFGSGYKYAVIIEEATFTK